MVTAQDGVTKHTYTITVTRAASSVASLNNLIISSGFQPVLQVPSGGLASGLPKLVSQTDA